MAALHFMQGSATEISLEISRDREKSCISCINLHVTDGDGV